MPALVIPKTYQDGDPYFEADIDGQSDAITTWANDTKLDSDNLQDAGIATAKLQDLSVVTAKLDNDAVTTVKITDGDVTLAKLNADAVAFLMPTGAFVPFGGAAAPTGYLLCDGAAVDRTTYADLYAVLGDAYGEGNGTTTFHLPDIRGRFIRGVDNAAGRDPDAGTRTASNTAGNTGDNVGSVQGDTIRDHNHTGPSHIHTTTDLIAEIDLQSTVIFFDGRAATSYASDSSWSAAAGAAGGGGGNRTSGVDIQGDTDASGTADTGGKQNETGESRPINASANYIIKT